MFGLTTSRTARARIRARDERIGELLQQRNDARKERDAFKYAAEQASEKYTDTAIVNDCLTEDLAKVRARLAEYKGRRTVADVLEEHDVQRKALAGALHTGLHLNWDQLIQTARDTYEGALDFKADYEAEKKRADHLETGSETGRLKRRVAHLQRQLDDAVGLPPGRVEDSSRWQPGYKTPKVGEAS